jgi:hypothetical protein
MVFAVGNMDRLAHKPGKFLDYDIMGDRVVDAKNRRGWIIQIVDGLERGSFSVMDGKIHRYGIECHGKNAPSILDTERLEATFRWPSAKQAIFDATAKWEAEEYRRHEEGS